MNQTDVWSRIYAAPKFNELVVKRRIITLRLFFICMLFFFSIPFLSVVTPNFLRIQVIGSINVGLLLVVAQYVVGGLIAWCYVVQLKRVDEMSKDLISAYSEKG